MGVALLAIVWKFGFEEFLDPFLPGDHGIDSVAERWEFVVAASLMSALALVLPAVIVYRLGHDRLKNSRLAAAVFNAAPQPMVVTDANRLVIAANPAFEQLTGYTAAEVIGQPIAILKSDQHDLSFYKSMGRSLDTEGAWSGEVHNQRPDGSAYVVYLSITTTHDAEGKVGEYVGVLTDITWRKQREEEALHLAMHDPLTGLPNRRLFEERLRQVFASAVICDETVALLYIDLDGFKGVNDTLGHAVGDEVLKLSAQRLAACARSADIVARLAGDEFVILLRNIESPAAAELVAGRCVDSLAEPIVIFGQTARVGASVGIALSSPSGTAADLLHTADSMMYAAKKLGRGTYVGGTGLAPGR